MGRAFLKQRVEGMSIQSVEVGKTCRVHANIGDLSSVVSCPSSTGTTVIFQPETNGVRWRADGKDPTASDGFLAVVNTVTKFTGDLSKLRFIQDGAGATLQISVFE